MKHILRIAFLFMALWLTALPAHAQEEDDSEGMLVRFLENTLSTDGSYIRVTGLQGALSSKATIGGLTIADDDGIWLSITQAELDWNRLALLRGRFSVNALTAEKIELLRKPTPVATDPALPAPEAKPFALPQLPVSIEIGELRIDEVHLDEPVAGTAARLAVTGSVALIDGKLDTQIDASRLDRPGDKVAVIAQFANDTRLLNVDLAVDEDQGGLLSTLIGLPDAPPLHLSVRGEGPLTDFVADLRLATENQDRLTGTIGLHGVTPEGAAPDAPQSIAFDADLSGDVTPMLPNQYHDFFGTDTALRLSGRSDPDGALLVDMFDLSSQALRLNGMFEMQPDTVIRKIHLDGTITPPSGDLVVLPLAEHTTLGKARFTADLDASQGDEWTIDLIADRLTHPAIVLGAAQIAAQGHLVQTDTPRFDGTISGTVTGLDLGDPGLRAAVGSSLALEGGFAGNGAGALRFDHLKLEGTDYTAQVNGTISGLQTGFEVNGDLRLVAGDLSRFSAVSGLDLTGSMTAQATGQGAPLGGAFDFELDMLGQDLSIGDPQIDPLMTGRTALELDAARSETGLTVRKFTLNGEALTAQASGQWNSTNSDLKIMAALDDVARVLPDLSGPLRLQGDVAQDGTEWSGDLHVEGPLDSAVALTGMYDTQGQADVTFDASVAHINELVPQLDGTVSAQGTTTLQDGIWSTQMTAKGPHNSFADLDGSLDAQGDIDLQFEASFGQIERVVSQAQGAVGAKGTVQRTDGTWAGSGTVRGPRSSSAKLEGKLAPSGDAELTYDVTLDGLERFIAELPGTLTAQGTANRAGSVWSVSTNATGPGGIQSNILGDYDQDSGQADITAKGQIRMDIVNLFISPNQMQGLATYDLRMNGTPSLAALSGTIRAGDTDVAIPSVAQTLENINATITLSDARATVAATGALRAGGTFTVNGPIGLTAPYDGQLVVNLQDLVLTDQTSFESSANGQIRMTGPMAGNATIAGQVTFGETNINLNAVSGGVGAAPIPPINHVGSGSAATATRQAAGLVDTAEDRQGGPVYGLDIDLLAPNRVFANGFGLQAELGGALNIGGTTAFVRPTGQIALVRGTLDVVGRRLKLTKGIVSLQGDLSPYVEFESATTTSDGQATFQIAGPIDAPQVSVFADPERPAEEALAMLLFGNRFSELSPFVIAQMAASLAAMGGAGGGLKDDARKKTGLDVIDVGTDESGAGRVGAGTYISDNIYTDLSVNTKGETELNLNLDLTESLTVRGKVDGRGDSAVGVFFERDY